MTQQRASVHTFSTKDMPGQRQYMRSLAWRLLYSGSFGAGKSRVGCEKGLMLSLKYPGNVGAIMRKTYMSLRNTTMQTFFRYVMPPTMQESYNKEEHKLRLINGSEILFLGLDSDIKIGSMELGWAYVDEAIEIPEDTWVMLDGRVGRLPHIPFSQLMATTNPAGPGHYLYKTFFLSGDKNNEVIEANSLDNPYLSDDYRAKLTQYKGKYYERYVLGRWISYEGAVYDMVDPRSVVVDAFKLPEHWPRYLGIDFGYSNPFVCQWWVDVPQDEEYDPKDDPFAHDRECHCDSAERGESDLAPMSLHHYTRCMGNYIRGLYMYREIYMSKRTVAQHAITIKRYNDPITWAFADHDAEDRATLEENGILTVKATKEISPGLQTVTRQFDQGRIHYFQGALVEHDQDLEELGKPISTFEELSGYLWSSATQRNVREIPQDRDNHGMDAMRYVVHSLLGHEAEPQEVIYQSRAELQDPFDQVTGIIMPQNRDWGISRRDWRRF